MSGNHAAVVQQHHTEHDQETRAMARRLLGPFGFTRRQKREVWQAFLECPDGVGRCAEAARVAGDANGNAGAGLLLVMIRRGDHRRQPRPDRPRVTGWRFVRGSHSGTFVPDPAGTDPLPAGYDLTDYHARRTAND
jgi:hypothetical protein